MVQFCCVVGCGNRSNRDKKRFFCLPTVPKKCDKLSYKADILMNMRKQWLMNINRDDLKDGGEAAYSERYIRICSDHFVSGKPSAWSDVENIDWAPTVNMSYNPRKRRWLLKLSQGFGSKIQPTRGKVHPSTVMKRKLKVQELKQKQRILKLLSLKTNSDVCLENVTQHPIIHRITVDSLNKEESSECGVHGMNESILSLLENSEAETVAELKFEAQDFEANE